MNPSSPDPKPEKENPTPVHPLTPEKQPLPGKEFPLSEPEPLPHPKKENPPSFPPEIDPKNPG
jgi:hypothetical protein